MGITVHAVRDQLTAVFHDELGEESCSDISSLLVLGSDLDHVLKAILDPIRLMRPASIRGHVARIRLLGEALSQLKTRKLPQTPEKWQKLVIDIHRYILTRTTSTASLKTRSSSEWLSVRSYLMSLVECGIIPISTYLPPVRDTLESVDITSYQIHLLGQSAMKALSPSASIDKLICSVSLARTDAAYLEELRDTLSSRRHLLLEVLTKHWKYIKANMAFGQKLINSVAWEKLGPSLEGSPYIDPQSHPAYPNCLQGLANYLAIIHHRYDGCPPSDDDFRKPKNHPERGLIPLQATFGSFASISDRVGAPAAPFGSGGWSNRGVLLWWLGRISHLDAAILTALLIMLHPSWTPRAVMLSKITNRDGKNYLNLSDNGLSYEVEKPRAKAMKPEDLDPLSYEIISTLIDVSAPLRSQLLNVGDAKASLLFLPYGSISNKVSSGNSSSGVTFISGTCSAPPKNSVWIGSIYPELVAGGLAAGTISFKKIRNTEGVLEWFKTKSLRAVARKLGNTEKVVLEHYIPKVLLAAWNTRMIRRFQNLWLSIAAAEEEFLLDVTDFQNLADLHAFLRDMLKLHSAVDSPLAELLHRKFGALFGEEESSSLCEDAHLHVAISKGALSALYLYQAAVIEVGLTGDALDKTDVVTGLSPRHFMSLADLLQSQLPMDKNPEHIACHNAAMQLAIDTASRAKWAVLFT